MRGRTSYFEFAPFASGRTISAPLCMIALVGLAGFASAVPAQPSDQGVKESVLECPDGMVVAGIRIKSDLTFQAYGSLVGKRVDILIAPGMEGKNHSAVLVRNVVLLDASGKYMANLVTVAVRFEDARQIILANEKKITLRLRPAEQNP